MYLHQTGKKKDLYVRVCVKCLDNQTWLIEGTFEQRNIQRLNGKLAKLQ